MADKTSSAGYAPKRTDSMIGPGVRFEGRINFAGVLRVVGELVGDVCCPADPQGTLVIEATGRVTGAVKVAHLLVRGRLQGPVEASQSIEVESGAEIDGDVIYRRIEVHPGGVVAGAVTPLQARDAGPAAAEAGAGQATGDERKADEDAAASRDAAPAAEPSARINRYPEPASPPAVASPAATPATAAPETIAAAGSSTGSLAWLRAKRRWGIGLALLALAALWLGRPSPARAPDGAAAPEAAAAGSPPPAAPPAPEPAADSLRPAAPPTAAVAAPPAVAGAPAPTAPERPAGDPNKVVAIQGGNAEKSPDIFFLISKEPAVLFKKKSGDSSDGTRIELGQGRNLSLAVSRDELYRVARGRELQLFYQGRKVPPKVIESGDWIRFVPASQ